MFTELAQLGVVGWNEKKRREEKEGRKKRRK